MTKFLPINVVASEYINETSKEYSLYVLENRGIANVWDGLKDGQRKAVYLLQKKAGEIKTVSLAGEMISSGLYMHGDTAASESIGKLAAPYQNNLPLIKGIGGFGTKTKPKDIAAPRYTYVKKYNVTESILYPDSNIVPMKENYDGSTYSPEHFLPIIPTVLLNGISGMAPGFSTNIIPYAIADLIKATLDVLNGKLPKLEPKYEYCSGMVKSLGSSRYAFYGNCVVIDHSTVQITELPPGMLHETFIERLDKFEEEKTIRDYLDETSDVINITVKFPRGFCQGWTTERALEFFNLCTIDKERLVVIDWDGKTVKQYKTAAELIITFVQERFKFYVKRYEKLLSDAKYELAYWELLEACFIANVPAKLTSLRNKAELTSIIKNIRDSNNLLATEEQIEKATVLPSYRWTIESKDEVLDKIDSVEAEILSHTTMLNNPKSIWAVYKKEIQDLQKLKFKVER